MNMAVTFTAFNRPRYLRRTLTSWAVAEGANDVPFYFSVEPGQPEVLQICKDFPYTERVWENAHHRGALGNPWYALDRAFKQGHEFVILAEDDAVVSPDVFDYFEKMAYRFGDQPSILAVCSFNMKANGSDSEFHRRRWFASTVWGLSRQRWMQTIKYHWGFTYEEGEWDRRFVNWLGQDGLSCVFPCISRSQHIGRDNGTHMRPADFESMLADSLYGGIAVSEWKERIL